MSPSAPSQISSEIVLAEVVEEFTNRLQSGESVDVESFVRKHPEHAERLRRLLPALVLLDDLSRSQSPVDGGAEAKSRESTLCGRLGDFRILREVGRGGMGVVYEAEQISLRRRVALKVLPFAATMDPRHLQRFHNEARSAACLHHPHIVPVYFVGCERGVHFYAMQFIDGQSLEVFLRHLHHTDGAAKTIRAEASKDRDQPGEFSYTPDAATVVEARAKATTQPAPRDAAYFRRAAEWGIAVAEALEHAHSLGIVHRDIKPGNLLIDGAGRLWVADFGLARTVNDAGLTLTGDLLGTLRYMSPEQALAKHSLVDHLTDIYSLGVTLYELLTLRPAIDGLDRGEVLKKIAFEEPSGARQLNRAIPVELETIVHKAMSKEPAERYATAKELADDLRRYLDDKPIRARPPSLFQRLRKGARRHRAVLWTAALFLLLSAAASAVGSIWHMLAVQATLAKVSQREHEVRQYLYVSDMRLAHQFSWKNGDVRQLNEYLRRHQPSADGNEDERGFAWHYLNALANRSEGETLRGHKGAVYTVAFAPDGRTLATAGQDGTVRLWNAASRQERAILHGHVGAVRSLAFSPDGQTLATAGEDRFVKLWDPATGRERRSLTRFTDLPVSVTYSEDGRWLVVGNQDGAVKIWDARTETLLFDSPPDRFPTYALVCRDRQILRVSNLLVFWDPQTGTRRELFRSTRQYVGGAWAHDGGMVAAGGRDGWVYLRDLRTGAVQELRSHSGAVRLLDFAPDDRWLVSGSDDTTVRVWDVQEGKLHRCFRGHLDRVCCVAFAPDGRQIASASADGTVKLWRLTEQPEHRSLEPALRAAGSLALSPDGTRAAVAVRDGMVRTFGTASWQEQNRFAAHRGDVLAAAFAPDGKTMATAGSDRVIRLWDADSGREKAVFRDSARRAHYLAFTNGNRLLAVGGGAGTECELWDARTGSRLLLVPSARERILAVTLAADGAILATARGSIVQLWDTATGRQTANLKHRSPVLSVVLDRKSGTLAAGLDDGGVFVWDLTKQTSQALDGADLGYYTAIQCLSFSPDGGLLAAAAGSGISVLHVANRQHRYRIVSSWDTNIDPISAVLFAPDSRAVVCVSRGGRLKRFELGGRSVHMPAGQPMGGVCGLAFAADGQTLLTASMDTHAQFSYYPASQMKLFRSLGGKNWQTQSLVLGNTREVLRLWDVASGRQRGHLPLHPLMQLHALAASGDGRIVAGAFLGDAVGVWELDNGHERCRLFLRPEDRGYWDLCAAGLEVAPLVPKFRTDLTALALSHDGRLLATVSKNQPVKLWNTSSGETVGTLGDPLPEAACLAFSPDDSLLAVAHAGLIDLRDVSSGQLRTTLKGHRGSVCSLAFSPRGGLLASGSQDRRIKLWDARTGTEQTVLTGHMGRVAALAFTPDERTLASGSWDGTVKLWHLATSRELLSLEGQQGKVFCVAFAPDGRTLASGGEAPNGNGQVCLWETVLPPPSVPLRMNNDGLER